MTYQHLLFDRRVTEVQVGLLLGKLVQVELFPIRVPLPCRSPKHAQLPDR